MWSNVFTVTMKYKHIWIPCVILLVFLSPYYILGQDTHIRLHDNMDSNIVWFKLLSESNLIFSLDGTLPNVINGLPRDALPSSLDAMVWLYIMFKPFTAYVINQTIMRFVAFYGMYKLLNSHFLKGGNGTKWLSSGVALCFALLPFWPSGALSIAGLPLAFHLFLTIRKLGKETPKRNWVLLLLIPFHSSFILTFIFFLAGIGLLWLWDLYRTRRFNGLFFTAIAAMTSIFLVKNYLLIDSVLFNEEHIPHRNEFNLGHKDLKGVYELFIHDFLNAHTHDWTFHKTLILPTVLVALAVGFTKKFIPYHMILAVVVNVLLSAFYAIWYWEGLRVLKDQFMLVNTFNFARVHFLSPLFWYLGFGIALGIIWKHVKLGKVFVGILIIYQSVILFQTGEEFKYEKTATPTFNEFYSSSLFADIEKYIGEEQSEYRVVSVGLHPAIAQYNGFYTLDTYNVSFPLFYKHQFREVIASELEESPVLENYFDTWGSRLYMYVSDLGKHYFFTKKSDRTLEQLDINTEALKELGGNYVFSALPIENHKEIDLVFEKTFENEKSPLKIYLYRIE
ncbi:DUF6044 family protein [Bacillus sp. Marseille-Q3570]|uniref:DUF6044 family protein n=1 Tax=Bacillus sp. Marseille-Q3570 TaxID=2963522 RepID=UPI0021B7CDAF|nr:DUF6044 family protein [Bacillus sp. Marseille-Q3570]